MCVCVCDGTGVENLWVLEIKLRLSVLLAVFYHSFFFFPKVKFTFFLLQKTSTQFSAFHVSADRFHGHLVDTRQPFTSASQIRKRVYSLLSLLL